MKKYLMLAIVGVCLGFTGLARAEAAIKVGVVDFQQALNQVNEGKTAKANLEAEFKTKQQKLKIQETELTQMRADLQKQAALLSEDKLKAKQDEFQQKFLALREQAGQYQQEMLKKESEMSNGILTKLRTIVAAIGQKEGFTLIVERSSDPILYVESKEDLTARVIKEYNSKN